MKADIGYWALSASEKARLAGKRAKALELLAPSKGFAVLFSGEADGLASQRFKPNAWFRDLTGMSEPGAALLLDGLSGEASLFCVARSDADQMWNGFRLGADRAEEALGLAAVDAGALDGAVDERLELGRSLFLDASDLSGRAKGLARVALEARSGGNARARPSPWAVGDFSALCVELRLIRDAREIERSRVAAKIASLGHIAAWESLFRSIARERMAHSLAATGARTSDLTAFKPDWEAPGGFGPLGIAVAASGLGSALTERSLEAGFMATILNFGADGPSYAPIVAAGENALCLHWNENRRGILDTDWVLCDMGASYQGFSSDITRTVPANGRFEGVRGSVYRLLLSAQLCAIEASVEGAAFDAPHQAAQKRLIEGLEALGALNPLWVDRPLGAPEDWDWRQAALKKIFPHATSHYLGRATHDVGYQREALSEPGSQVSDLPYATLRRGMVITIEPGLYFFEGLPGLPEGLAGFGARIEDDILIAPGGQGPEVLSRLCPKDPEEIEKIARSCGL